MAMQEYKIVNATQLDSDLAELASKYRDTFGIDTATPLVFPESFIETVDGIEKRNSLLLTEKTITAPAGYYKFDTSLTLPADYINTVGIKKTSDDMIFNADNGTITAPAGYYESNATLQLPNNYVDISDKTITEIPDAVTIATALPAGTQITIPAGYYSENIVIASSQTP